LAQAVLEKPRSSERSFRRVEEIVEECGRTESSLIPILQKVQDEYRYLPQEILAFIATALDIPPATVFGVATFYAQFSLEPKGKHVIRVCDGTACHVRGNKTIIDAIRKKLGLNGSSNTTPDLAYTLETVSCLGACGLAPAVVIDDKVYGRMTPDKITAAIDEIEANGEGEAKN